MIKISNQGGRAMTREDKIKYIIEKLVKLGVIRIVDVQSDE